MRKKISLTLSITWMILIFYLSNQSASVSSVQSGNFINIISNIPILGDIVVYLMQQDAAQFIIRKSAHMFLYFILNILLFISMYNPIKSTNKTLIKSLLLTFIYACTDEIHQIFIPGRSGEFRDVMVDSIGALIGAIMIYIVFRFIEKRKSIY